MSSISRSAFVPYAAEQMYDLVNDIEAYPEFLLVCRRDRACPRSTGGARHAVLGQGRSPAEFYHPEHPASGPSHRHH